MPIRPSLRLLSLSGSPWFYFSLFLAANLLLSYVPLPFGVKLGIGLLGLVLPFVLFLSLKPGNPGSPAAFLDEEAFPPMPGWAWLPFLLAALAARFVQLTTLSGWPLVDEGIAGFFATELSEGGKLNFFYSYAQWPPFFVWSLGAFFKLFGPSLSSLWLYPALLSSLALPLAYMAARAFFPKSFAWVFAFLWAFNFTPLFLGRLCQGQSLEILWQLGAFVLLGLFLLPKENRGGKTGAALLGLWTGTGFYTLHHWPAMALFVLLAVAAFASLDLPRRGGAGFVFLGALLLAAFPYLAFFFGGSQGTYLKSVFAVHPGFSLPNQLRMAGDYASGLFWGVETERYAYKPLWGGFLNPLIGSLFLVGLGSLIRERQNGLRPWLLLALGLFSLPALLSSDLELLRWLLVFAPLLAVGVIGLFRLVPRKGKPGLRRALVLGLLMGSSLLDLVHLWGPYRAFWSSDSQAEVLGVKSLERLRAYRILGSMSRFQGPGLIFTELGPAPFDQTFSVAVYPFNAARNPRLPPSQARWAALLADIDYAPFLSKRYPQARWFLLAPETAVPRGNLVLGVIPLTASNWGDFSFWLKAEGDLRGVTSLFFHMPLGQTPRGALQKLLQLEPEVRKDPFLESCVAERIFFSAMSCSDPQPALEALRRAITKGYSSANLLNDLGVLWWTLGDGEKAREAFKAALRSPVDHTPAAENLQRAY